MLTRRERDNIQAHPDLNARSPWATLDGIYAVEIQAAAGPIRGHLTVPGSKSYTNRALILAAAADGTSRLTGVLRSDDSYWCVETLRRLGVNVQLTEHDDTVIITGVGARWPRQDGELYIGASGTNARFFPGLLAAAPSGRWRLTGSRRMQERPMQPLLAALRELGADIESLGTADCLPIDIRARGLDGGDVQMSGAISSQFISGVLMAAPFAKRSVRIRITDHIVQHAYVHITLDLMRHFGAKVEASEDLSELCVQPGGYVGRDTALEADASTSCYFLALAAVTRGDVRIDNLGVNTRQPDAKFVDILERMGCAVERGEHTLRVVGPERLRGDMVISMKEMSDQALTLAAIAPFADGPITITDVAHIRAHESDRIQAMCASLTELGIQVEEHPDGMTIHPGTPKPATLASYDDHRMAMSLSLIGAVVGGVRILDPGCVSKTCPTYFDHLAQLGIDVRMHQA
ncbi:MAG: 3-phosphoshikimate 1-carboxyvinyltransferase [Alicyclobacillus sp.]|nr:3-phosphoshikimate 1-carboxyvinyltransferase [Alicyclobacillus sp.]